MEQKFTTAGFLKLALLFGIFLLLCEQNYAQGGTNKNPRPLPKHEQVPDTTNNRSYSENSYSGSSGSGWSNFDFPDDPRVFLIVAAVAVAVGAVVISNDVYVHRSYSFLRPAPQYTNSFGWCFGLRKTFDYAAIEYGGTYSKFYNFSDPNPNVALKPQQLWGAHISYVHQVFHKQTGNKLRFYIGPTANYYHLRGSEWNARTFGIGGIAGAEFKVYDRLKLDLRYACTTQSNELQAGFTFKYQKKSPWEEEE